jgi:diguanylate cyclase (GGDEF)-like protein/PAS domain S-box-containing protein
MTTPRARILAIDDNPANLLTLGAALESEYELQIATSGPAGLALALHNPPDLILLDIMMPEVDGFETFRRLVADPALKHIPVIFVTAMDQMESEVAGLQLGAADYITKPIKIPVARQRIRNLLEREHLRKEVQLQRDHLRKLVVAVEQSPASVVITNLDACLEYVNQRFTDVTGYAASEVMGRNQRFLQSGQTSSATYRDMWDTLLRGQVWKGELINQRKNGEIYWEESQIAPIRDGNGVVSHYVGVKTDITERKRSEQQLRLAASVFIHAREGIMITDAGGLIIDVNQTFSSITGYSRDEVLGKSPRILRSNKHDPLFYAGLWHDLHTNDFWSGEIWNSRKNGDVYPEHLTISVVRDEHGAACQFVALFSDISERKALEEQARKLAFYDSLTELPNRRLLDDRLAQAIASSKRSGCYCALMFLDLDNFKQLNDLHGHASGDLLLIEVAKRLTNCVREVDTVVRFGGDEFVVLLSQLDTDRGVSTEQAGAVAEKIRVSLAANYTLNIEQTGQGAFALEHRCSASIGVVVFASQNAAQADILKWADAAMYRAKDAGRNTIKFYGD